MMEASGRLQGLPKREEKQRVEQTSAPRPYEAAEVKARHEAIVVTHMRQPMPALSAGEAARDKTERRQGRMGDA